MQVPTSQSPLLEPPTRRLPRFRTFSDSFVPFDAFRTIYYEPRIPTSTSNISPRHQLRECPNLTLWWVPHSCHVRFSRSAYEVLLADDVLRVVLRPFVTFRRHTLSQAAPLLLQWCPLVGHPHSSARLSNCGTPPLPHSSCGMLSS